MKLTSSKHIINKIYRDFKPSKGLDVNDVVNWIDEALQGIGCGGEIIKKTETITISSHRGCLPCDLYTISQVSYKGFPLMYGSQTFDYSCHDDDCQATKIISRDTYTVQGPYINTSFEEGEVCLYYRAFQVCKDGFPLIPDTYSFREAVMWYCVFKMALGGYEHPALKFQDIEQRWLKYCSMAENEAKVFSIDQYESFMRNWLRLSPNRPRWDNFFDNSIYSRNPDSLHVPGVEVTIDPNYTIPNNLFE